MASLLFSISFAVLSNLIVLSRSLSFKLILILLLPFGFYIRCNKKLGKFTTDVNVSLYSLTVSGSFLCFYLYQAHLIDLQMFYPHYYARRYFINKLSRLLKLLFISALISSLILMLLSCFSKLLSISLFICEQASQIMAYFFFFFSSISLSLSNICRLTGL